MTTAWATKGLRAAEPARANAIAVTIASPTSTTTPVEPAWTSMCGDEANGEVAEPRAQRLCRWAAEHQSHPGDRREREALEEARPDVGGQAVPALTFARSPA